MQNLILSFVFCNAIKYPKITTKIFKPHDLYFLWLGYFSPLVQVYKMNFDNAAFKHRMPQQKTAPSYEKLPMKRGIFFDMFPFSVIFRRDMTMYRIGDGLKEVFSDLQGKKVNEEFTLVRPMLEFSWDNVSSGGFSKFPSFLKLIIWPKTDKRTLPNHSSLFVIPPLKYCKTSSLPYQIYTHLNNVFELLSKAVVESKQKVNIPKLSKEEPEEKEESEKTKREEERGSRLSTFFSIHMHKKVDYKWLRSQVTPSLSPRLIFLSRAK